MGEIKVTPQEVHNKADEIKNLNAQFKGKVDNLTTAEQSLVAMYEGPTRNAFDREYNKDKAQWETFHKVIEQYVQALHTIADKYAQKEMENLEIANTRKY